MKKIFLISVIVFSSNSFAMTLTKDFVTTSLRYNTGKKYYETSFVLMAGVYKADEKFFKCLQTSLEKKKPAKVTFEPMGLKITACEI